MSNPLRKRLDAVEATLGHHAPGQACDQCDAPRLLKRGLVVIVQGEEAAETRCPGCGRRLDPRDGRPLSGDCTILAIVRGEPPVPT